MHEWCSTPVWAGTPDSPTVRQKSDSPTVPSMNRLCKIVKVIIHTSKSAWRPAAVNNPVSVRFVNEALGSAPIPRVGFGKR